MNIKLNHLALIIATATLFSGVSSSGFADDPHKDHNRGSAPSSRPAPNPAPQPHVIQQHFIQQHVISSQPSQPVIQHTHQAIPTTSNTQTNQVVQSNNNNHVDRNNHDWNRNNHDRNRDRDRQYRAYTAPVIVNTFFSTFPDSSDDSYYDDGSTPVTTVNTNNATWVAAQNGAVPSNAVVNSDDTSQVTYYCRAVTSDATYYGVLIPNDACYVQVESNSLRFVNYDVMVQ